MLLSAYKSPDGTGRSGRDVALACRVLAQAGLAADVLGHVSVRVGPGELLIRCRARASPGCCSPPRTTCIE